MGLILEIWIGDWYSDWGLGLRIENKDLGLRLGIGT